MFSRYFPQCPDCSHRVFEYRSGVLISWKAAFCRVWQNSTSVLYSVVPRGVQKAAPGATGMDVEEVQLAPELAMIALLGFLDAREVLVELLLREERRAVDALHRLVLRVALPVGVARRRQLERLELARRRHVRTDAEIEERVLVLDGVDRHVRLAGRLLLDQLHLERLAAPGEEVDGFLPRPRSAARRRGPATPVPSSSLRSPRGLPARTAARRRSRRRSRRQSADRCRTARLGNNCVTAAASRWAVEWR